MTTTIRDIASACGVGVTTVSRAINNESGIAPETKQKILETAKRLNYTPNTHARRLRFGQTHTIAVLMKGTSNPFFLSLLEHLEGLIHERGYQMDLVTIRHEADEIAIARHTCSEAKPAGLIFLGGWLRQAVNIDLPVPYVFCTVPTANDTTEPCSSCRSVVMDEADAMDQIVTHLSSLGHRRIAFLGSDPADQSVGKLRLECFRSALKKNNLEFFPELVAGTQAPIAPYSLEYGHRLTKELWERTQDFTALVTISDLLGIGAMKALHQADVDIPGRVSVTGIDGITMSEYTHPTLTTVTQPAEEIAKATVQTLFSSAAPGTVALPGKLRIGESTGPAPSREVR